MERGRRRYTSLDPTSRLGEPALLERRRASPLLAVREVARLPFDGLPARP
jgi:hypothetical protein